MFNLRMEQMRLIHYIGADYQDGAWGGAARFDHELRKALPEIITCTPKRKDLNKYLNEPCLIVTDNGMVMDFPLHVPAIVAHNGIARTHLEREPSWGLTRFVEQQNLMYQKRSLENTFYVGTSAFTTYEFFRIYGVKDYATIPVSVDTVSSYPYAKDGCIVGDWRTFNKGEGIIDKIKNEATALSFQNFKCGKFDKPEGYKNAMAYLGLSLCEGACYSILDAMACNVPVISTNVGICWEDGGDMSSINLREWGGFFDWRKRDDARFVKNCLYIASNYFFRNTPRQWLLKNLNFDEWKRKWRDLINDVTQKIA